MPERVPESDRTMLERVADGLVEFIEHQIEIQVQALLSVSGRPPFTTRLTKQERLERYLDPKVNADRVATLTDDELLRYYDEMQKIRGPRA